MLAPIAGPRLPAWAAKKRGILREARPLRRILRELKLTTVCEAARCPNIGECFARPTATFMIAGDRCTRRCGFCAVDTARPGPLDADEPARIGEAARRMALRHVVITETVSSTGSEAHTEIRYPLTVCSSSDCHGTRVPSVRYPL